jgi:hypothetical protein
LAVVSQFIGNAKLTHAHPWTIISNPCPPKTHGHGHKLNMGTQCRAMVSINVVETLPNGYASKENTIKLRGGFRVERTTCLMNPMLNYDSGSRLLASHGLLQPCCRFAGDECKMVKATSKQLYNHIINSHVLHNILPPYGSVPSSWNMLMIFGGSSIKLRLFIYYSYIQVDARNFGWSYIHGTIHMNHYSSRYYSLEKLFIVLLSLKKYHHYSQHSYHLYPTLFIICTVVKFFP